MASKSQHAAYSVTIHGFDQSIVQRGISNDRWRVIFMFYATLQAVDAYLSMNGLSPVTHEDRDVKMTKMVGQLAPIFDPYKRLKQLSKTARYKPDLPITATDLSDAEDYRDAVCAFLRPLLACSIASKP